MRPTWTEGNTFTLLENGEAYYPRVFECIAAAREEVLLETFILFDDPVGRDLQRALLAAARNGAEVHVLVDGWGSPDLSADFLQPLADAGVRVRAFDPVRRLFGVRLNAFRRMHRKLVVVDGAAAFVGGINYSADHLEALGPKAKQDYAVEVHGPLVGQVQAFCRQAIEVQRPVRRRWWARSLHAGSSASGEVSRAAFVVRDNGEHTTDIEQQYRAALRLAQHRVVIANAYFFPGFRLLQDLRRAAQRGVQVDLILQGAPDLPIAQTAASTLHAHLMRAGVRIHEYCRRPLHAKVATVDDRWATVGSSNLDPTSLGLNMEANVVMDDPVFARALRENLDALMAQHCHQVAPEPLSMTRSIWARLRALVVFHFLRRFPVWSRRLPAHAPTVAALRADTP